MLYNNSEPKIFAQASPAAFCYIKLQRHSDFTELLWPTDFYSYRSKLYKNTGCYEHFHSAFHGWVFPSIKQ